MPRKPKLPSLAACEQWADRALREIAEEYGITVPDENNSREEVFVLEQARKPRRRTDGPR